MSNLKLGTKLAIDGRTQLGAFELPSTHLLTHGVVVGMTGTGKTGLLTVLVEEALSAGIPVLMLDVKGDLPNLALAFPSFDAQHMAPWVEAAPGDEDGVADPPEVTAAVEQRKQGLTKWSIGETELAAYAGKTAVRVITPGSDAGESVHLFTALERRSARWDEDLVGARATLSAAISLVLELVRREGDPGKSREHALLMLLAERHLKAGEAASLETLIPEILEPPLAKIGALTVDGFMSPKVRAELAADLNTLVASPTFAAWREGQDLDVAQWMESVDGKTPATIVSVAHLDDDERQLVLGVVLEEVLSWVRSLPGTARLRAMVVMDEVYGLVPPHPAAPPTKRPIVSLMKQARAYGVGCVLATQNPMDLDYRSLSNAGTWVLGRLPTDADRSRVLEGLGEGKKSDLAKLVKKLAPRWFVVRDAARQLTLLNPRWAMSYLRGPMTQAELRRIARAPKVEKSELRPSETPPRGVWRSGEHVSAE